MAPPSSLGRRRGVRQRQGGGGVLSSGGIGGGVGVLSELTGLRREVLLVVAAFGFAMMIFSMGILMGSRSPAAATASAGSDPAANTIGVPQPPGGGGANANAKAKVGNKMVVRAPPPLDNSRTLSHGGGDGRAAHQLRGRDGLPRKDADSPPGDDLDNGRRGGSGEVAGDDPLAGAEEGDDDEAGDEEEVDDEARAAAARATADGSDGDDDDDLDDDEEDRSDEDRDEDGGSDGEGKDGDPWNGMDGVGKRKHVRVRRDAEPPKKKKDGGGGANAANEQLDPMTEEEEEEALKAMLEEHGKNMERADKEHASMQKADEMTKEEGEKFAREILKKHEKNAEQNLRRNRDRNEVEKGGVSTGLTLGPATRATVPNIFNDVFTAARAKVIVCSWIRVAPPEDRQMGKKRILSVGPEVYCNKDGLANDEEARRRNGMIRLYVNHDDTADEELILEWSADGRKCHELASVGSQVPPNEWTHVGFSLDPDLSIAKLYINGKMVAEEQYDDEMTEPYHFPPGEQKKDNPAFTLDINSRDAPIFLGRGVEHADDSGITVGNTLDGQMEQLAFWFRPDTIKNLPPVGDTFVETVYRAGYASARALLDLSPNQPDVLYPMNMDNRRIQQDLQSGKDVNVVIEDIILGQHGTLTIDHHSDAMADQRPSDSHQKLETKPTEAQVGKQEEKQAAGAEKRPFADWVPLGGHRYEEYKDGGTPTQVTPQMMQESDRLARTRREHVRDAMKHLWSGYKQYAWGSDELLPGSLKGQNNWGGMGTTLVDSLDTLWLMGMKDEFWEGRDWVRDHLSHEHVGGVSVFETTIRSLGGLLSAYDWSQDPAFLKKADDLGSRLFHAFESPNGIPYSTTVLNGHRSYNQGWLRNNALLAEFGTLQIEFRYLAKATNKTDYATKANRVFEIMEQMQPESGLYPIYVTNNSPETKFGNNKISFGAMGDSFYEYLLKVWLQGGKEETYLREMYDKAMDGVHEKLVQKSKPNGLTYIADLNNGRLDHKMDHLACFMGGLLALGAYTHPEGLDSPKAQRDLTTGKALTYTCYQMYARMKTGLSPEYVKFAGGDDFQRGHVSYYILRPETVESMFILNYLTGDPVYREWGWEIFQAIERYCRKDVGFGHRHNVDNTVEEPENRMESFFPAETLKYLYLLQDPDTEVDILNKHVFNTEAHPMRRFDVPDLIKDLEANTKIIETS